MSMIRFIFFFLIVFLLAQNAFSFTCPSGLSLLSANPSSALACEASINSRNYGACFYSHTNSSGVAYFYACRSNTAPPGGFDCPDPSYSPDTTTCKGGRPYETPSDPCKEMGKDGVDGWRVVGEQCVFSHDFCTTVGDIELFLSCNQSVCTSSQITLPDGSCIDDPNQSCNPNSPDYVGTFPGGIHLCNGESAPEGFDPLNDPACSVQTGTMNGDSYTYVKCMTEDEKTALGDDAVPDSCGKDKVFLNGSCQSTPLVSDVYDDEAIVLHDDGTSTKTTTTTTKTTDKSTGETTTTTTKTITNYDANGAEVGSETSTESKTEKSTAHGGASCEVAPACTGDAVQCAILHQTWLNRCSSQSDKVTLDSIDFGTSDIQGGGDFQSVELIDEDNKETHDVSAIFSNLPAVGSTSASCPVMNLELGEPYGTLNFDFKPICDFGDYTRPIFSAIGYFILGMFLFATLRRL